MTVNYFQQANQQLKAGELKQAIASYQKAIEKNPHFAWYYQNLADALAQDGQIERAIANYEKTIRLKDDSAWSHYKLGKLLLERKQTEQAIKHLQRAIDIQDDVADFYVVLGKALSDNSFLEEAEKAYQKARQINPETVIDCQITQLTENNLGLNSCSDVEHLELLYKPSLDKNESIKLEPTVSIIKNQLLLEVYENESRVPTFSILTVSRSSDNLSQLLYSIAKSINIDIQEIEIICSWNGSEVDEKNILIPKGMRFRIVDRSSYHFASNINVLAKIALSNNLCIVNDDVKFQPETLFNALKWLNYPNIGLVGSILLFPNGKIQHCGISFKDDMTPVHIDKGLTLNESNCIYSPRVVDACTGALLFVKKIIFNKIQMIETFEECGEDICFCIDVKKSTGLSIIVPNDIIAEHKEGYTRSYLGRQGTPKSDLDKIRKYAKENLAQKPSVYIETEEKGWIFHRKAEEIQQNLTNYDVSINKINEIPDIIYFIHYARYNEEKAKGKYAVANFTHFVPGTNSENLFRKVAKKVDHCIAVSESTRRELLTIGIPNDKISVIEVGAAKEFQPKIVLGIVGRIYNDGRKGEDIVKKLNQDKDILKVVELVSMDDCWGVKTLQVDSHQLFYSLIDYLLVPSRIEGGPVPFMEALACGKLSIAPPVGVIPSFPHIGYRTGDYDHMKKIILETAHNKIAELQEVRQSIKNKNWERWAFEHGLIFDSLLRNNTHKKFINQIYE